MFETIQELSQHFLDIKAQAYHRYFFEKMQNLPRMAILLGQRGIGKTTLLIQYLLAFVEGDRFSKKILYVQADHFLIGKSSLYEIAEQFYLMGGRLLAIDEIHKYTNWAQELKSLFDTFPDLQIIASGSSALAIYHGSHDLSRRAITYHVQGLSFREYLELRHKISLPSYSLSEILKDHQSLCDHIIEQLKLATLDKVLSLFSDYLRNGYYPYSFELNNETLFYMTLEQNLHATIEVDLVAIYPQLTGNSIQKIKKLLLFIAGAVPFTPNWNKLMAILEIGDQRTLKTYFKYLTEASLIRTVNKISDKMQKISAPDKIYLDNPNQMYAIASNTNKGTLREVFFLDMLSEHHQVDLPMSGDFLVDEKFLFEIGGRNKTIKQIHSEQNAFIASDDIEMGINKKIPLWIFGFLY